MRYIERDRSKAMSERKYRTYTEEFKAEALVLQKSNERNALQIEWALGIIPGMLLQWII
jgi:transposase-like protein